MAIKVLLVEDDRALREALADTLLLAGHDYHAVGSAEEALKAVECEAFSLVVSDVNMPGMDGLTAAKLIREVRPNQPEPIIVMVSGHAKGEMATAPGAEFADAFLSKPVTASSLYDAVVQALGRRQGTGVLTSITPRAVPRLMGVRALIVDDSDINREVAQRIFEREGAQVFLANDGQAAVDWLRANPQGVDVVLMDLQMPVLDGLNATELIRQDPLLQQLPVIALSAGVLRSQRDAALAVGMNDFIAKPLDVDAAVSVIGRATGRVPARAVATTAPPTRQTAPGAESLPGLDLTRGLQVFQNVADYQQYLRIFARDYAHSADFVAQATAAELAPWLHKLKGAAANLGVQDVAAAAGALDSRLQADPTDATGRQRLVETLITALHSIAEYAAPPQPVTKAPADALQLRQLLDDTLAALDHDNPDEVDPLLDTLAKWLPDEPIDRLRTAVQRFDFRLAEAIVKDIAAALPAT